MFCKKCGSKLDDHTQFCPNCGSKVEQEGFTNPKPFETHSVDESKNPQFQQSAFKGVQYSTGSSGHVSFGNRRKKSLLGQIIKIVIGIAVVVFIYQCFFSDNGPIYNIQTASSIDYDTYEAIDIDNTFSTTTPEIFITFSVRDYDIGTVIQADWYYLDGVTDENDGYIDSSVITVQYDDQDAYISMTIPNQGWPVGEYEVNFFAGDEYVISVGFTIE